MLIYGVSFDLVGKQPIVLLKTADGNKFLPIWIGHPEAAAILMKLQGASTPRPMTHDLLSDMLEQLDAKCERVSRSEERRVGKSVDLGGRRYIKKKKSKAITPSQTYSIEFQPN